MKENQRSSGFASGPKRPAYPNLRVPLATYRLQFNDDFTFEQATEVTDYLRDLGISDCYASPIFRARAQSSHGYDVCSFEEINPSLGGASAFQSFAAQLRELGMGLLVDMVPNHMAADACNPWWRDVLKRGKSSRYASWFDIDWHRPSPELREKVLLPVLEDDYRNVLESGKLKLVLEPWGPAIAYYDRRFPISGAGGAPGGAPSHEPPERAPLTTLSSSGGEGLGVRRQVQREQAPPHEQETRDPSPRPSPLPKVRGGSELSPEKYAASSSQLEHLLAQQHYRLACWRLAPEKINYRRFFDITELVSVRMELPEVFAATHELLLRLIKDGLVTGLRIDHPDGLWDPQQYCERLQAACRKASSSDAKAASFAPGSQAFYIVVEKILTGDEQLPPDWPVAGTTGYDFLIQLNGLFVNTSKGPALEKIYERFCHSPTKPFRAIVHESKKLVLRKSFAGELTALARRLQSLAGVLQPGWELALEAARDALTEVVAAFPVYRTYIGEKTPEPTAQDRQHIIHAIAEAKAAAEAAEGASGHNDQGAGTSRPRRYSNASPQGRDVPAQVAGQSGGTVKMGSATGSGVYDFIQNLLLLQPGRDQDEAQQRGVREFVMRFQQLTAPAMAKGLEDTAFYNYDRLVSLNEVGGDPGRFGTGLDAFHDYNLRKAEHWPHSMLATATHDTKRGEDLRARINVISELPDEWERAVMRWRALNADKKSTVDGELAPDANDEYLLYQTLVGAWPADPVDRNMLCNRIAAFMLKAIKEAKAHTSWTDPNTAYERATQLFVERTLSQPNSFIDELLPFQRRVAFFGQFNSLSQTLIKIAAPGVPDFYQGTELWDFSLVDPDNRRQVDYGLRRRLLNELKEACGNGANDAFATETAAGFGFRPEAKLYLIWRALECRRRHQELFERGSYQPLSAEGPKQEHACAFARILDGKAVITVAPRLVVGLAAGVERAPLGPDVWQDAVLAMPSELADRELRNAVTGETVRVDDQNRARMAEVLRSFPVAILERSSTAEAPRPQRNAEKTEKLKT